MHRNQCRLVFNCLCTYFTNCSRIIWLGDLNYRIAMSYCSAKALVEMHNWKQLLEKDQVICYPLSIISFHFYCKWLFIEVLKYSLAIDKIGTWICFTIKDWKCILSCYPFYLPLYSFWHYEGCDRVYLFETAPHAAKVWTSFPGLERREDLFSSHIQIFIQLRSVRRRGHAPQRKEENTSMVVFFS